MIFYKTVTSGNDFIHIDQQEFGGQKEDLSNLSQKLCSRRTGIGADGLICYQHSEEITKCRIFNQDGSEAELSGNGIAGLASLMFYLGKSREKVSIQTRAGLRECHLLADNHPTYRLKVEMGSADFSNQEFFPFLEENRYQYTYRNHQFYPVSVGNPHIVILLKDTVAETDLEKDGFSLENAEIFPARTNVEFVRCQDEINCSIYYHERGVGRTLSSSTGSAAVYAVLQNQGLITDHLLIQTPAGTIMVSGRDKIFIENSTKIMYKGKCLL